MKTKNRFKLLPPEDQQKIIDLCDRHPYTDVLDIIAKPRSEGGLQLQASYSALCRFYLSANREARKTTVLRQTAASLQYQRHHSPGAFRTALVALLERRLFEALTTGEPVSELKDELAALKDLHRGFLAEEKWKHEPKKEKSTELSLVHLSGESHFDFLPLDEEGRPTEPPPLSPEDIASISELDEPEETPEITPEDIARLDEAIALGGEEGARHLSRDYSYPKNLIRERIRLHREKIRARGITAYQAALEIHRQKHGFAPDGSPLPANATNSVTTTNHKNPPKPPAKPLIST